MNAIIDLCKRAVSYIGTSTGWVWISIWIIIVIAISWKELFSSSRQNRWLFIKRLFQPISFRGRESLSDFRNIFFGMTAFLLVWTGCFVLLVGFSPAACQQVLAWVGVIGMIWAYGVWLAAWVRRCHDLGYSAWQGFWGRQVAMVEFIKNTAGDHTLFWQTYFEQGEPESNQFGPAPEENIPRVLKKEEVEFPEVWPEDPFER